MKSGYFKKILHIIFKLGFLAMATVLVYIPKSTEFAGALSFLNVHQNLYIENLTGDIKLAKNYSVSDELGLKAESNIFKVVNNTGSSQNYKIKFLVGDKNKYTNLVDNDIVRYSIKVNDGEFSEPMILGNDGIIALSTVGKDSENVYQIKMWLNSNDKEKLNNKVFQGIIQIYSI